MRAVLSGCRVVFEEEAIAVRPRGRRTPRRKRGARRARSPATIRSSRRSRGCCCPFVNPVWLQYLSHKVGRLLVPWALVALFVVERGAGGQQLDLRRRVRRAGRLLRPGGGRRLARSARPAAARDGSSASCRSRSARRRDELGPAARGAGRVHVRDDELRGASPACSRCGAGGGVEIAWNAWSSATGRRGTTARRRSVAGCGPSRRRPPRQAGRRSPPPSRKAPPASRATGPSSGCWCSRRCSSSGRRTCSRRCACCTWRSSPRSSRSGR